MTTRRMFWAASVILAATAGAVSSAEPRPVDDVQFAKLRELIRPQAGESRWMEINWYPNVWEARQRAAAEGKPLYLMAGSGGAPAAGC